MTDQSSPNVPLQGSLSQLASVERAAYELRSGRAVFVLDETEMRSVPRPDGNN